MVSSSSLSLVSVSIPSLSLSPGMSVCCNNLYSCCCFQSFDDLDLICLRIFPCAVLSFFSFFYSLFRRVFMKFLFSIPFFLPLFITLPPFLPDLSQRTDLSMQQLHSGVERSKTVIQADPGKNKEPLFTDT